MNKAITRAMLATLVLAATISNSGEMIPYEPESVSSIAAVSNTRSEEILGFHSGIFVAYSGDHGGHIVYLGENRDDPSAELIETVSFAFREPTAIAESDGDLVVWDDAERVLYQVDLRSGKRIPITDYGLNFSPSQIAISPEGLVVLLDQRHGRVFWTTLDSGDLQSVNLKTESTSIAFLSWNKLAILDRDQQSIAVVNLQVEGDWLAMARDSELSLNEIRRSRAGDFRAIASQDGALYVADDRRIYSYIEATGELVLAVDDDANLQDIRQLEVSAQSFYVLDGNEFTKVERTVPVEFVFEEPAFVSQLALLELYDYLGRRSVLPTRETVSGRNFNTLEEFLVEENVFIASTDRFPETKVRGGLFWMRTRSINPTSEYQIQYDKFEDVFCARNSSYCSQDHIGSIFLQPVASGTILQLPNLALESRLGVKKFMLQGPTASEYLDALIVSPELRTRADDRLLRRLNKGSCGGQTRSCLQQSRGELSLPYETWSVNTAVLTPDLTAKDSAIRSVIDYGDIHMYSQQVYTKQSAYSHHLTTPSGVSISGACKDLNEKHEAWLERLSYPADYERFVTSDPRVAVVEHNILKNHQVFELQSNSPTWYEYDDLEIDFIAKPEPASLAGGNQTVDAANVYTRAKHHGTHVAAIIGGRSGHCWSGLLPESRLIHIDASSAATIGSGVFEAHSGFVRVINISQRLSNDNAFQKILWDDPNYSEILYVLAAGNEGEKLNTTDIPSAVVWGQKSNVIVVTALDDSQQVLGSHVVGATVQPGANWGKRLVDLAAPGLDLYSATENRKYGPATGTSQAAPAVSAAAAYLIDENVGWARSPGQVKARLIATANWHPDLEDKVWGGMLNLGDAVRFPDRNIIRTASGGMNTIFDIGLSARAKFTIENYPALIYDREQDDRRYRARSIKLNLILSLKANGDGTYRMVFRNPRNENKLEIILAAQLSGDLRCQDARVWKPAAAESWPTDELCDEPIDVSQIVNFYRAVNYDVDW